MPNFRIQAKYVFLTYAQADDLNNKDNVIWELRNKVPSPEAWACGEEVHENGGKHFHVLLRYADRVDIRDERFFDIDGKHPNIQGARAWKRVLEYCIKGGDYIEHGFDIAQPKLDVYDVMREEIQRGGTANQTIEATINRTGTQGLRLYNQIANFVDRVTRPSMVHQPIKFYPDDFVAVNDTLGAKIAKFNLDCARGRGERGDRKSLWLFGASRMGKTVLARSLGDHWYMMGAWNVECIDDSASYGVMDDISWDSMKFNYKGMLGLQLDVTVTDKYKKKSVIKGGRPVIILSNTLPVFTVEEDNWLSANVVFHFVNERVFE